MFSRRRASALAFLSWCSLIAFAAASAGCSSDSGGATDATAGDAVVEPGPDGTSTTTDGTSSTTDGKVPGGDATAATGAGCAKAGGRCECSCGGAYPIDAPEHNDCPQPCDTCGACTMSCCLPDPDCDATAGCVKVCEAGDCSCQCPPQQTPCGDGSCERATEVCVGKGPFGPSVNWSCEPLPAGCEAERYCSCLAAELCEAGDTCVNEEYNRIFCDNGSQ